LKPKHADDLDGIRRYPVDDLKTVTAAELSPQTMSRRWLAQMGILAQIRDRALDVCQYGCGDVGIDAMVMIGNGAEVGTRSRPVAD